MSTEKIEETTILLNGNFMLVSSIPDESLTVEQYETILADTYGWRSILPKLNAEALAVHTQKTLDNSLWNTHRTDPTYEASLKYSAVPELLRRLLKGANVDEPETTL